MIGLLNVLIVIRHCLLRLMIIDCEKGTPKYDKKSTVKWT